MSHRSFSAPSITRRGALPAALLAALAAGCAGAGSEADPAVLATYRGGVVDAEEAAMWLPSPAGGDGEPAALSADLLTEIALSEALAQAAEERGADRDPEVARALQRRIDQVLVGALRRRVTAVSVSDEEVESRLEASRDRLERPRRVRLRSLLERVAPDAGPAERDAARRTAESWRRRILAGESMAAIARAESDSAHRYRGGLIGAVAPGELAPAVERVAFALEPGEVSPVLETAEGFVLLECVGVIEAKRLDEEEARRRIRDWLARRRAREEWEALRRRLVAEAEVELEPLAPSGADPSPDAAVARWRGGVVRLADLAAGEIVPDPAAWSAAALSQAVERAVFARAAADEARRRGLDALPEVRRRVHRARLELLRDHELERRARAAWTPPSREEAEAWVEAEPDRFVRPAEYRVELVRRAVDQRELPRLQAELERAAEEVAHGRRQLAAVAAELSDHPSAARGGDLGWLPRPGIAALGPAVLGLVESLEPGRIGGPVLQDSALWLVRLVDRRPGRPMEPEAAREEALRRLAARRWRRALAEERRRAVEELAVEVVAPGSG